MTQERKPFICTSLDMRKAWDELQKQVIGDNANLASRLQDLTRTYVWPILISESTHQKVKDEFDAEFADAVTVKGNTRPANVYKVIGRKGALKSEQLQSW